MVRVNERWVIGSPLNAHSSVWRVWSNKSDVYATGENIGLTKLSFHESGRCRYAFTSEHGTPSTLTDRATIKWWRATTPEPDGQGRCSLVMALAIPTDYLSIASKLPTTKPISWIEAAPTGMATSLEMMFTKETEQDLRSVTKNTQRHIILYKLLPNGEAFVVAKTIFLWMEKDFGMPASHHEARDFIFSKYDPNNSGRPIRLTRYSHPKDGDWISIAEFGGYPAPAGTWERIRPR